MAATLHSLLRGRGPATLTAYGFVFGALFYTCLALTLRFGPALVAAALAGVLATFRVELNGHRERIEALEEAAPPR